MFLLLKFVLVAWAMEAQMVSFLFAHSNDHRSESGPLKEHHIAFFHSSMLQIIAIDLAHLHAIDFPFACVCVRVICYVLLCATV